MKIEFLRRQIFEILMIHKPSLESLDVPQKFGPDRFSRFDVYRIQTDSQAKFIYIDLAVKEKFTLLLIYLQYWQLFVCLYPINVKTAEPIGPKFFGGHHVPTREGL